MTQEEFEPPDPLEVIRRIAMGVERTVKRVDEVARTIDETLGKMESQRPREKKEGAI